MKDSDEWETPQELYEKLNQEFKFSIDLCATDKNRKAIFYCINYLDCSLETLSKGAAQLGVWFLCGLDTKCYFMNPPYSKPKAFIKKAWEDSKLCKIVCLLKCDTSTSWWGVFWDYEKNEPRPGCEIRFLPKRLKFERDGVPGQTAPFPSVIVIMDRRDV